MLIDVKVRNQVFTGRVVSLPKFPGDEIEVVFGNPYSRVRWDDKGPFINTHGQRVPVTLTLAGA